MKPFYILFTQILFGRWLSDHAESQPPTCVSSKKTETFHAYLHNFSLHYCPVPLQISTTNHMKSDSVLKKKATQLRNFQITRNSGAVEAEKCDKLSSWPLNYFDEEKGSSLEQEKEVLT